MPPTSGLPRGPPARALRPSTVRRLDQLVEHRGAPASAAARAPAAARTRASPSCRSTTIATLASGTSTPSLSTRPVDQLACSWPERKRSRIARRSRGRGAVGDRRQRRAAAELVHHRGVLGEDDAPCRSRWLLQQLLDAGRSWPSAFSAIRRAWWCARSARRAAGSWPLRRISCSKKLAAAELAAPGGQVPVVLGHQRDRSAARSSGVRSTKTRRSR